MVDKNLFLHDLAVVAILKNEGRYLKEWLDYHLLAGVDHFYLYDNDSTDNQAEVAEPYVEAGLVDYFSAPGKSMQYVAYTDAVKQFKFHCRYMTFIDSDEFIYPKNNQSIVEVLDGILPQDTNAAGLAMHFHYFGSNGQKIADYSRGVLERFTRRAPNDWETNKYIKTIADPRKIKFFNDPHAMNYFTSFHSVDENLNIVTNSIPLPVLTEKIVVNHYYVKSEEEYKKTKVQRGWACANNNPYDKNRFNERDRNEEFDDGILNYRANRAEKFFLENRRQQLNRVTDTLIEILSAYTSGALLDLETALTCRALSTYLRENFPADADSWRVCEEISLNALLKSLSDVNLFTAQLLIRVLPDILRLPYPAVKEIRNATTQIIPRIMKEMRFRAMWGDWAELDYILYMLKE